MIIIPARLKSSRFEEKILVDVLGLPMFVRTAYQVKSIDEVVVATDSQKVIDIANKYNIKAIMTSEKHQSGTDRVNEAVNLLNLNEDDIIINLQADEPFIEKEVVDKVRKNILLLQQQKKDFIMVSCYKEIDSEIADDPNFVKVVINKDNFAIYFSRSKIPYHRDHYDKSAYFGHLGIYGFNKKSLNRFCNLKQSILEDIEKLEQLRAIYNSLPIYMVKVKSESFGIDTQEDLNKAVKLYRC